MSDIKNSHIQGDLTISPSITDTGLLRVNLIEETTTNSGISILTSDIKVGKKIQFKNNGSLTTDAQLDNSGVFKVINNTGNVELLTSSEKGIIISDVSGNVTITSTTDSIDENTGSLITTGGVVVGKTLNVKENINSLDGVSSFKNTSTGQNVIDIVNTNTGGKSSINFQNTALISKLEIGYGNSGVSSPLTDASYIQSVNGSELLLRANSQDSIKLSTNGSIDFYSTLASSSSSVGALRIIGGISISNTTDAVSATNGGTFTTAGGLSVAKKVFLGETLNISNISTPTSPGVNVSTFYVDNSDNLFKSKNSSGVITIFQPNTTKGDLVSHNGTVAVRLPVGTDGYTLVSNSSTPSGLEWVYGSGGGGDGNIRSNNYNLTSINVKNIVIENPFGAYIYLTYPLVENGSSAIFFTSRNIVSTSGISVRFNSNSSLSTFGVITLSYPPYKGVDLRKSYSEGDGNYIGNSNEFFSKTNLTLSGTSWIDIGPSNLTGCFCFSIGSVNNGPCASFILTKNISSSVTGNITRIVSAPSATSGVLNMRWQAGSPPQIRKSNSNDDGIYTITDNFQDTSVSTSVILSGTSRTTLDRNIFGYYENKSFLIKITSVITGAPYAIFTVSKNSPTRIGNITSYRSPGDTSGELLSLFWDSTSLLELSKSGVNFNGTYDILFTKLT